MNENDIVEETIIVEVVPARKSLTRKALIVAGSVVGIVIAGAWAYLRTASVQEEESCDCYDDTAPGLVDASTPE